MVDYSKSRIWCNLCLLFGTIQKLLIRINQVYKELNMNILERKKWKRGHKEVSITLEWWWKRTQWYSLVYSSLVYNSLFSAKFSMSGHLSRQSLWTRSLNTWVLWVRPTMITRSLNTWVFFCLNMAANYRKLQSFFFLLGCKV